MALTDQERHAVSIVLRDSVNPAVENIFLRANPPISAVEIIVEYLRTFEHPAGSGTLLPDATIKKIAIAYSLSTAANANEWSADWCTAVGCPVRGKLIDRDSNIPVEVALLAALNADPEVIKRLKLAAVFPTDLQAVRAVWVEFATHIFPAAEGLLDNDANAMDLRVGLHDFVGGDPRTDCKGLKCPGVANVGCC